MPSGCNGCLEDGEGQGTCRDAVLAPQKRWFYLVCSCGVTWEGLMDILGGRRPKTPKPLTTIMEQVGILMQKLYTNVSYNLHCKVQDRNDGAHLRHTEIEPLH